MGKHEAEPEHELKKLITGGIALGAVMGTSMIDSRPAADKAGTQDATGNYQEQKHSSQAEMQLALEKIGQELKDPAIGPEARAKLEVQKKSFELAMQAFPQPKSARQEQQ